MLFFQANEVRKREVHQSQEGAAGDQLAPIISQKPMLFHPKCHRHYRGGGK